jgi:hypothetical protein
VRTDAWRLQSEKRLTDVIGHAARVMAASSIRFAFFIS